MLQKILVINKIINLINFKTKIKINKILSNNNKIKHKKINKILKNLHNRKKLMNLLISFLKF